MPDLKRLWSWARFEPSIGDNLELPVGKRFFLELAVGLTKVELDAWQADLKAAVEDKPDATFHGRLARAYERFVRLGSEPLSLNGQPIATLEEYFAALWEQPGAFLLQELGQQLVWLNSFDGARGLFSVRHSGGSISTGAQSVVKGTPQTAGR